MERREDIRRYTIEEEKNDAEENGSTKREWRNSSVDTIGTRNASKRRQERVVLPWTVEVFFDDETFCLLF